MASALRILFCVAHVTALTIWDTGEKNVATVKRLLATTTKVSSGQVTDAAALEKLAEQVMSNFAPAVNCSVLPSDKIGFRLENVPFPLCTTTEDQHGIWAGTKTISAGGLDVNVIAVDPSTGKTVLAQNPFTFVGVTNSGAEVPGTRTTVILTTRYDFNEDGKIASTVVDTDYAAVAAVHRVVSAYNSAAGLQEVLAEDTQLSGKRVQASSDRRVVLRLSSVAVLPWAGLTVGLLAMLAVLGRSRIFSITQPSADYMAL